MCPPVPHKTTPPRFRTHSFYAPSSLARFLFTLISSSFGTYASAPSRANAFGKRPRTPSSRCCGAGNYYCLNMLAIIFNVVGLVMSITMAGIFASMADMQFQRYGGGPFGMFAGFAIFDVFLNIALLVLACVCQGKMNTVWRKFAATEDGSVGAGMLYEPVWLASGNPGAAGAGAVDEGGGGGGGGWGVGGGEGGGGEGAQVPMLQQLEMDEVKVAMPDSTPPTAGESRVRRHVSRQISDVW